MNNLQNNVKKLRIAVYALVIISVFNLLMLFMRPTQKEKEEVILWQDNLQTKLQELQVSLVDLQTKLTNTKQNLPQAIKFTSTMENSMQSSVSLILTNIEEKQNKFKHLNQKIVDLSKDISSLKKRFSTMEKNK